ncbi:hypothetical protein GM708_04910 [Vibrio cholerae]|nr:hypothetical protein [Vibrio cholerae]
MNNRKTVKLPDIPSAGEQLEDFIAALFQASGQFVEKSVVEADPLDLLELDIVVTTYESSAFSRKLIEVKGGKWGYTDLFKVVGWMRYLGISEGAFFVTSWNDLEGAEARFEQLNLKLVRYSDFDGSASQFTQDGFGDFVEPGVIALWRHSYNLERNLMRQIHTSAKTSEGGRALKKYHRLINNGTFFSRTPEESLSMLYEAFKEHPKVGLGCAQELDGVPYNPLTASVNSSSYREALYEGKHPLIQASMYIEHRARLAILKAAVDYALGHPQGPPSLASGKLDWGTLDFHVLPASFKDGLRWLMKQDNFARYAIFWQQFLWGWGGFYLKDRESTEFSWMSKYSGIPTSEIPIALQAFDRFFPGVEWFATPGNTSMHILKMTPWLFQGIGAHHRRAQYEITAFSELKSDGYTAGDLSKRINSLVEYFGDKD